MSEALGENPAAPRTGGCQCGAVRYELTGRPVRVYVCHCTECRAQSSSAFGISVITASHNVRLLQGELCKWTRKADSGGTVDCYFCPVCGSRVWHGDRQTTETISIKGGSLDEAVDISRVDHIWTQSRLPGAAIPDGARCFARAPDD